MPVWLTPFLSFLSPVLDRILPDKAKQDELKAQLAAAAMSLEGAQLQADLQLALAQADVNKIEAASPNLFVSGWRPFIGWICGVGVGYHFVAWPFWEWCAKIWKLPDVPILDVQDLYPLVLTMLGLGAMRSFDKKAGTS
jgi:hypothetical protein